MAVRVDGICASADVVGKEWVPGGDQGRNEEYIDVGTRHGNQDAVSRLR